MLMSRILLSQVESTNELETMLAQFLRVVAYILGLSRRYIGLAPTDSRASASEYDEPTRDIEEAFSATINRVSRSELVDFATFAHTVWTQCLCIDVLIWARTGGNFMMQT